MVDIKHRSYFDYSTDSYMCMVGDHIEELFQNLLFSFASEEGKKNELEQVRTQHSNDRTQRRMKFCKMELRNNLKSRKIVCCDERISTLPFGFSKK